MIQQFKHILKIALLLGAIFLCGQSALAQTDWLNILPGADKLSYDQKTGMQRMVGHLSFTYQGTQMFCDSAHAKAGTREIWAYGQVHLNKNDTLNLFCDSLYYNGFTKKSKLWGNVRLRDREYKVSTDTLEYDAKISQAIYRYGGRIENITTKEVLTSKLGIFTPIPKKAFSGGMWCIKRLICS